MSEDKKILNTQSNVSDDSKTKMLAALARKQRSLKSGKSSGTVGGSKVGVGKTGAVAPKIHRRKAGSA